MDEQTSQSPEEIQTQPPPTEQTDATAPAPEIVAEPTVEPPAAFEPTTAMFTSKREKIGFWFFVAPVITMSFVSMTHLVRFFSIGNDDIIAWLLGGSFELASMSTIAAMVLLRKISKGALWSILLLLYALQLVGNVYSPFAHIDPAEASRLFQFFGLEPSSLSAQRIIAVVQGAILPTVALVLSKLLSDYLKTEES